MVGVHRDHFQGGGKISPQQLVISRKKQLVGHLHEASPLPVLCRHLAAGPPLRGTGLRLSSLHLNSEKAERARKGSKSTNLWAVLNSAHPLKLEIGNKGCSLLHSG